MDDADLDEDNFINEIEDTIEGTFFKKDSIQLGYVLTDITAIRNESLCDNYKRHCEHLRLKSDFFERYLLFIVKDEIEADLIRTSGFICDKLTRPVDNNLLGNSDHGINLIKHLDVMLRNEYRKRTCSFKVALVKAAYNINRIGIVNGSFVNEKLPEKYNCLMLNSLTNSTSEIHVQNFQSTMFFYENDKLQLSNLLPYAMLKFELENPYSHDACIYRQDNFDKETNSLSVSFNDNNEAPLTAPPSLLTFQTTLRNDPLLITKKQTPKKKFSFSKKPIIEEVIRSSACQLNKAFLAPSPHFNDSHLQQQQTTEPFQLTLPSTHNKPFAENISITRRLFEKSKIQALNKKFKANKKMLVVITDLSHRKLKFANSKQTFLSLRLSENRKYFPSLFPIKKIRSEAAKKTANQKTVKESIKTNLKLGEKSKSLVVKSTINETTIKSKTKPSTPQSTSKTKSVINQKSSTTKSLESKLQKSQSEVSISNSKSTPKRDKTSSDNKSIKTKSSTPTLKVTDATKQQEAEGASLSSEMTSLEKRLLGLDKTKSLSKIKTNQNSSKSDKFDSLSAKLENVTKKPNLNLMAQKSKSDVNVKVEKVKVAVQKKEVPSPKKPTDIKEELRKINAKLSKEKKQRVEETSKKVPVDKVKAEKVVVVSHKRKKSFWDPDSDTEYDTLIKRNNKPSVDNKPATPATENDKVDEDDDLIGDEYVIVSKPHLNVKPVQYSKPFYDLNINGLENELKKFNDDISPTNITVTKHIKAPVDFPAEKQQQQQQQQPLKNQQQKRLNRANYNKQRFMHHYITNTAHQRHQIADGKKPPKFVEIVMNQMDVDSLKQLKIKSKSQKIDGIGRDGLNGCTEIIRHEIHAGGFRCIEEHQFQRIKRAQSFDVYSQKIQMDIGLDQWNQNALADIKEENTPNMQKKINLTDYLTSRAKSSRTSTPQAINFNSNPNSVNSCDVNNQQLNESTEELKPQALSPAPVAKLSPPPPPLPPLPPLPVINEPKVINVEKQRSPSPVKIEAEQITEAPPVQSSHKRSISLSLIDEVKKQVNTKKSPCKDDNFEESDNEKSVKSKNRKKPVKKHRSRSKKTHKKAKHSQHNHHSKRKHHHSSDSSLSLDSSLNSSSISISSIDTDSLSDNESELSVSSINSSILSGSDLLSSTSSSPLYHYKSSSSCSNSFVVVKNKNKRSKKSKHKKQYRRKKSTSKEVVKQPDGYDDGECTDSDATKDSLDLLKLQTIKDDDYSLDLDLKDVQMLVDTNKTTTSASKIQTHGKMYSDYEFNESPSQPLTTSKAIPSPEQKHNALNQSTNSNEQQQQQPRAFYTPNQPGINKQSNFINKSFNNDDNSHNNNSSFNRNQFKDHYNKLPGNSASSDFNRSLTENTANQFQSTYNNYQLNENHDVSSSGDGSYQSNYQNLAQSTISPSFPNHNKQNFNKNPKNYNKNRNQFNNKFNNINENQIHNNQFNNQFVNTSYDTNRTINNSSFNQSFNQQASFKMNNSGYQLDNSFNQQQQFQDYSNFQTNFTNQNFNDQNMINSNPNQQRSNFNNNNFNNYNNETKFNKYNNNNNNNRNNQRFNKQTNKYNQPKNNVKNFIKTNQSRSNDAGTSEPPTSAVSTVSTVSAKPPIDKEDGEID